MENELQHDPDCPAVDGFGCHCDEIESRRQLEDDLIDTVIEEIKRDIEVGDVSAIWELLSNCPTEQLIQYLPEEKWGVYKELRA